MSNTSNIDFEFIRKNLREVTSLRFNENYLEFLVVHKNGLVTSREIVISEHLPVEVFLTDIFWLEVRNGLIWAEEKCNQTFQETA